MQDLFITGDMFQDPQAKKRGVIMMEYKMVAKIDFIHDTPNIIKSGTVFLIKDKEVVDYLVEMEYADYLEEVNEQEEMKVEPIPKKKRGGK